ncbi:MAG: DUF4376 domain-containing protein [Sporomusaceae bacterium]|nr:DUF4376 domain-containing protein [Sporomusaceae bacterium]
MPVYVTPQLIVNNEGVTVNAAIETIEVMSEPGTVQIGEEYDLSTIPVPNIELSIVEWHQAQTGDYKVINNVHTYSPPPPPTLDELKAIKRPQINVIRDAKEQGGFLFNGKSYDSDSISVQRISIAAQNALAAKIVNTRFEIDWTLADNSSVTLDADGILGVSQALAVHAATVHSIAKTLKDAVDAATTVEEVDAVTWPEGGIE